MHSKNNGSAFWRLLEASVVSNLDRPNHYISSYYLFQHLLCTLTSNSMVKDIEELRIPNSAKTKLIPM